MLTADLAVSFCGGADLATSSPWCSPQAGRVQEIRPWTCKDGGSLSFSELAYAFKDARAERNQSAAAVVQAQDEGYGKWLRKNSTFKVLLSLARHPLLPNEARKEICACIQLICGRGRVGSSWNGVCAGSTCQPGCASSALARRCWTSNSALRRWPRK